MGCIPPGSSVHGIFRARILKSVAISISKGSSGPRDRAQVFRIKGGFFTTWATKKPIYSLPWVNFPNDNQLHTESVADYFNMCHSQNSERKRSYYKAMDQARHFWSLYSGRLKFTMSRPGSYTFFRYPIWDYGPADTSFLLGNYG